MKSFIAVLFSLLWGPSVAELIGPHNITESVGADTAHGNLRRRQCSPSASVTKRSYASGEQVQVIINICKASGAEWFGIWQAGSAPGSAPAVNWQFTCGGQSCARPQNVGGYLFGLDANTVSIGSASWPLPSGSYIVYYHSAFGTVSTATFSIGSGGSSPSVPSNMFTPSNQQNAVQRLNRPIRVACVGDSLTLGSMIIGKGSDYCTQLAQMLWGYGNFEFYNFGVNGVTAIKGLPRSYDRYGELGSSFSIKPDIYLLMLGTNDHSFWDTQSARFPGDLGWIVDQAKNSSPSDSSTRVILAIPPWTWWVRRANVIKGGVIPQIRNVANSKQVQLVDMWQVTEEQRSWYAYDGLHLNKEGYRAIASTWFSAIQCNQNGICEVGETCSSCPSDCFVNC